MKTPTLLGLLATLVAAILIGCGGGSLNSNHHSSNSGSTSSTSSTSSTGEPTTAGTLVTKANGGTVAAATGTAVVVIPAGAVVKDVRVQVNQLAATAVLPTPPQGLTILGGTPHELLPDGLWFATSSSLTIAYNTLALPSGVPETSAQIYTVANGEWQPVTGSVVNAIAHNISVPIGHFSTYAVLVPAVAGSGPRYDVIDIGVLAGDTTSVPTGISSTGKVCGYSTNAFGTQRAFLWSSGIISDLGKRAGDIGARANGVNAYGSVVGISILNSTTPYPVLFSGGIVTQLSTTGGQTAGTALGINDSGDVLLADGISRNGALTAFKDFSPGTGSACLNAYGDVVGYAADHAAAWSGGRVIDLGAVAGYDYTVATAISDDGTVVGNATNALERKPVGFVWQSSKLTKVSPLGADNILSLSGVNTSGQIVGTSSDNYKTSRGVLYENGKMTDLNTLIPSNSGWTVAQALGINNRGQIIATGVKGTTSHALLLSPRP